MDGNAKRMGNNARCSYEKNNTIGNAAKLRQMKTRKNIRNAGTGNSGWWYLLKRKFEAL
jgi:hypothetical protein